MKEDSGERLDRLFDEAQIPRPFAQPAFLDAACGDDDDLRAELESLLEADAQAEAERFLSELAADLSATLEEDKPELVQGRPVASLDSVAVRGPGDDANPRHRSEKPLVVVAKRGRDQRPASAGRPGKRKSSFARFLMRYRAEVIAAAGVAGSLLAGLGAASWQTRKHQI